MHSLLPYALYLPPLAVTLAGGRTAWLWGSLAAGTIVLHIAITYVTWNWANGRLDTGLDWLIASQSIDRAYHDTYYVVADLTSLGWLVLPAAVIGLLLLLPGAPRRAPYDLGLFWAAAVLVTGHRLALAAFAPSGMPRRYVDYDDRLATLLSVSQTLWLAALIVMAIAAFRPVQASWRARRAN